MKKGRKEAGAKVKEEKGIQKVSKKNERRKKKEGEEEI